MGIGDFLDYLKFEKRYSDNTVQAYRRDLTQFIDFLEQMTGSADLSQAGHAQVRAWMVELSGQGVRPASIKRKISALNSYYKHARRKGRSAVNPAAGLKTPRIPERLPKFIPMKDLERLFEKGVYFPDNMEGLRDRLMLQMLYETGMRRAELIGLRWEDVDAGRKVIRVRGKGGKTREIPAGLRLLEDLGRLREMYREAFRNDHEEAFIFLTDRGTKAYPKFVYNKVTGYLDMVSSMEKRSPHVLRHSFATHLSNNGAQLNDIKELLGHASLSSTQIYTHNSIEELKRIHKLAHPKS